ncbi:hypothetical protein BCR32DRAFT_279660 [Anaeromyces robustus]|uniref:Uncharacterized protein n=1 Tax=Anaeromyces robustus TaxID=1754192 RepID=A0A1Y1X6V9_9FUNG|nr:hypothetical protein BCR32DRAFT_279660 [Anaeromyces robustus]|eukprot:ORX81501.1 hypothetical protein BCR32DRAFT_279660 [Anaeromyces robustus]
MDTPIIYENIPLYKIITDKTDPEINSDIKDLLMKKAMYFVIVASETIYLMLILKCLLRWKSTKDWRFIFPLTAALFAFANNFNDIMYVINAPDNHLHNCEKYYINIFKYTATLNWTPISIFQILRLFQFTRGYYKPFWHRMITVGSISLSIIYCCCYYYNLLNFKSSKNCFFGCANYNLVNGTFVEVSDIMDSGYSLVIMIFSLRNALLNLKQYKLRHQKLKALKDESIIVFIILTGSKVVIYSIILSFKTIPGGDIFWDILSVIVIYCSYRIVNFKPKLIEKLENNRRILNNNINYINMNQINNINKENKAIQNEVIQNEAIQNEASTSNTNTYNNTNTNINHNLQLYERGPQEIYNLFNQKIYSIYNPNTEENDNNRINPNVNIPKVLNKDKILHKNKNKNNNSIGQLNVSNNDNNRYNYYYNRNNMNYIDRRLPVQGMNINMNNLNFNSINRNKTTSVRSPSISSTSSGPNLYNLLK